MKARRGSVSICSVGAALFTIFVKGAGLHQPDRNQLAWKCQWMFRKPALLNATRVRHPIFEPQSGLKHPANLEENLNDDNLTRYSQRFPLFDSTWPDYNRRFAPDDETHWRFVCR